MTKTRSIPQKPLKSIVNFWIEKPTLSLPHSSSSNTEHVVHASVLTVKHDWPLGQSALLAFGRDHMI